MQQSKPDEVSRCQGVRHHLLVGFLSRSLCVRGDLSSSEHLQLRDARGAHCRCKVRALLLPQALHDDQGRELAQRLFHVQYPHAVDDHILLRVPG